MLRFKHVKNLKVPFFLLNTSYTYLKFRTSRRGFERGLQRDRFFKKLNVSQYRSSCPLLSVLGQPLPDNAGWLADDYISFSVMIILFQVIKRGEWLPNLQSQRIKNGLNNYIKNIRDNCRSCLEMKGSKRIKVGRCSYKNTGSGHLNSSIVACLR